MNAQRQQGTTKKTTRRHWRRAVRRALARVHAWLLPRLVAMWRMCGRLARWSGRLLAATARSLDPCLCFVCICIGVAATLSLPPRLWVGLVPLLAQLGSVPLTAFPIAQIPAGLNLETVLLSVLPLALAVFRRHYFDWRDSQAPLAARILFAMYAGVCWPRAWWPQRPPTKPKP